MDDGPGLLGYRVRSGCWRCDGEIVSIHALALLTALEYKLLSHFLQYPAQVHSREQLLAAGDITQSSQYERNIDTHIKSLRAKLRRCSDRQYLLTHRGFGYLCVPAGQQETGPC
ncbi:MAG: hypothetical protein E6Q75_11735 [Rheinheimera sp.]|nr:MAG: hypothetical protein E6Q75_11735 [Rheinheimera sp.]